MAKCTYPKPEIIEFENCPKGSWEVEALVDNRSGLCVYLSVSDAESVFAITFSSFEAYLNADEGARDEYWRSFGGYLQSGCYHATQSGFLDWAKEERIDKELPEGLRHFIVATANDVVDVLSFDEPAFIRSARIPE
jgi:hypothetical protein